MKALKDGKFGKLEGVATVTRKDGTIEEVPFTIPNVRSEDVQKYIDGGKKDDQGNAVEK